jgi:hypothetical protein
LLQVSVLQVSVMAPDLRLSAAPSIARDLGRRCIHVAYVLIDAVIDAPRTCAQSAGRVFYQAIRDQEEERS